MKKFVQTDLYCITASEHSKGRDNIQVVQCMLEAGVKVIQFREKDMSARQKLRECEAIRRLTQEYGADFIVNDDVALAVITGADGVHIGQDDLPIERVRELSGGMYIGLSTHSPKQAQDAVARGADYIGVGPIYRTFTKKDVCEPVGLEYLDYVVKNIHIPFVAIGGIKLHNIREVASRGAGCIACVTEITGADDVADMVRRLRERMCNT